MKNYSGYVLLTVVCNVVTTFSVYGQESFPKGIYTNFKDFASGTPADIRTPFYYKTGNNRDSYRFYCKETEKRLRKAFDFSDGTSLYVRMVRILQNLHPDDFGKQSRDNGNYHIKAKKIGRQYIYFEEYLIGSSAAILGGLEGVSASRR